MKYTVLITGANRGIGLEFTKQYAQADFLVHACCRHPNQATELQVLQQKHPNIQIHQLDVTSAFDIKSLKQEISGPIDILINNAGMLIQDPPLGDIPTESLLQTYQTNTIAPLKMLEAFIPHLMKGHKKIVACVSSSLGSISENTSGGYYSYRSAKTALNMLMVSAGHDLADKEIKVVLLHPGWVRTRMGGAQATVTPEESVNGLRKVIDTYQSKRGEVLFYRYNGEIVPW